MMIKLKFIVYVSGLFICVLSFKTVPPENSPSASDYENEQATEDNRLFGPQKCYTMLLLNYWLYGGGCTMLPEERIFPPFIT